MVNFETEQATPKYHSYSEHDRLLFKNAKSRIPDIVLLRILYFALHHCVSFRYFSFNITFNYIAHENEFCLWPKYMGHGCDVGRAFY